MYNPILLDHFQNPRNAGRLGDANGVGFLGDPDCGDFMCIFVRVDEWQVKDISFLCRGCPASIASASATTELAKGKMVDEIVTLTPEHVAEYLGGMPEDKAHCSNLGVGALRYAMADYLHSVLDEQPESETAEV